VGAGLGTGLLQPAVSLRHCEMAVMPNKRIKLARRSANVVTRYRCGRSLSAVR